MAEHGILAERGLVRISGKDSHDLLQSLLTSDLDRLKDGPLYTGLLTPQGKVLFDLILWQSPLGLMAETALSRVPDLIKRLTLYKLRADMVLADASDQFAIAVAFENAAGFSADPRHPDLPYRALVTKPTDLPTVDDAHRAARIKLGVAELEDFDIDGTFWLETGAREQGGVDFDKGCYVGQEVTARMKHKTELRKGLVQVEIEGDAPVGAEITGKQGLDGLSLAFGPELWWGANPAILFKYERKVGCGRGRGLERCRWRADLGCCCRSCIGLWS